MTMPSRRVLVVDHWHDDNRGDSAITQSILRLLRDVEPDADVRLAGPTEDGPGWERSIRLVRRSFPAVPCRAELLA
jgi:polysaccharide pyruvyl transferase WcaK-like protein